MNRPDTSLNKEKEHDKPMSSSIKGGVEFVVNPRERSFLPRFSYLFTYVTFSQTEYKLYFIFVEELRMGGFSMGINQNFPF